MANKVYIAEETPIVFSDSGGSYALTLTNLAASAGRVSARADLGSGSRSEWYAWRFTAQFDTAPVVGEQVQLYLATSDGTEEDGQVGTADAALDSSNTLTNLHYIGALTVTSTDADHDMTVSGVCRIPTRYVSAVVYNATADALRNDAGPYCEFTLTPIPPEVQ